MRKAEKVHFSVAIRLYDMEMLLTSTPMNSKGQGQLATMVNVHLA